MHFVSYLHFLKNLDCAHFMLNCNNLLKIDCCDLLNSIKFPKSLTRLTLNLSGTTFPEENISPAIELLNDPKALLNTIQSSFPIGDQIANLKNLKYLSVFLNHNRETHDHFYILLMMYCMTSRTCQDLSELQLGYDINTATHRAQNTIDLDFLLKIIPYPQSIKELHLTSPVFYHRLSSSNIPLINLKTLSIHVVKPFPSPDENISRTFQALSALKHLECITISDQNGALDESSLTYFYAPNTFPSLKLISLLSHSSKLSFKCLNDLIMNFVLRRLEDFSLIFLQTKLEAKYLSSIFESLNVVCRARILAQNGKFQKNHYIETPVPIHLPDEH
jgi:hypothetical protein